MPSERELADRTARQQTYHPSKQTPGSDSGESYTSYTFSGQNTGVPGRNSFVAVAGTRDAVAYAEFKRKPSCILSLDFKAAFDEASHHYLFRLIKPYGYSGDLLTVTQARYDRVHFSVQVYVFCSEAFQIAQFDKRLL